MFFALPVGSMDTAPLTTAQGGQESFGVTGQSIDNPGNPSSADAQGGQISSEGTGQPIRSPFCCLNNSQFVHPILWF